MTPQQARMTEAWQRITQDHGSRREVARVTGVSLGGITTMRRTRGFLARAGIAPDTIETWDKARRTAQLVLSLQQIFKDRWVEAAAELAAHIRSRREHSTPTREHPSQTYQHSAPPFGEMAAPA
ncbi:hypothetical protein [Acuticoccus kandeliae]|uniref:hypothetical protein n=1 Tax=Acuticoccus kandeliae TaxID=2073160 RepID=UPI000D3ECDB2|nr:hypothetical protein [Acuticoccus kandeliae]